MFSKENGSNYIEIILISRQSKGSFQSQSVASVNVATGVTVSFNNTEFVTAAGTSYNGIVKAFAAYLDPTADNFAGIMPGDLVGINTSNSPVTS